MAGKKYTADEIEIGRDLLWAINDNDLQEFQKLCAQHSWLVADTLPGREESILEYVIAKRRTGILKYMLQNGFSANPKLKSTETTPLESAIDAGESDVVQLLISHGADPNLGRPIIGAINLRSDEESLKYVKLLVEHGCDLNRIYDLYGDADSGFTAFDWAKEKPKIANYIRSQGGLAAPEVRAGKTPVAADEVIAHFERTVGPASKKSLIQIVSTGTPVGIHVIPPDNKRQHLTLFTNGLSSKPMNATEGSEDYRFAELFIELPGDWKIKEVKDMQWAWPLYWLRKMAQYPHAANTWLGGPVTLMANQNPPQPLWPDSKFTALLLVAESSFKRRDGNTVQLYRMIPLYTSERAYEIKHGLKRFMQALDQNKVPFVVDVDRQPFV